MDTDKNVRELLDALYSPSQDIKDAVPEKLRDDIKKSVSRWADDQTLYFHTNYKTGLLLFLLIILFLFLGVGITLSTTRRSR